MVDDDHWTVLWPPFDSHLLPRSVWPVVPVPVACFWLRGVGPGAGAGFIHARAFSLRLSIDEVLPILPDPPIGGGATRPETRPGRLAQPSPFRTTPGSESSSCSYTPRCLVAKGCDEAGGDCDWAPWVNGCLAPAPESGETECRVGMVLNCLELRRLDSDLRCGTLRVVDEPRRAGVEGTPRSAGGLSGTVRDGSARTNTGSARLPCLRWMQEGNGELTGTGSVLLVFVFLGPALPKELHDVRYWSFSQLLPIIDIHNLYRRAYRSASPSCSS